MSRVPVLLKKTQVVLPIIPACGDESAHHHTRPTWRQHRQATPKGFGSAAGSRHMSHVLTSRQRVIATAPVQDDA
ncbi:hypothetical protein PG991_013911 [Apiospora marii]|uniref:Secreted protein n=1 Tax=Apiospora marii TaxID=335849 RepID=A0ABR1R7C7_9PEZI